MTDHNVESVQDAVALASQWRQSGSHSWFRGQARTWKLTTSLARREADPDEYERARGRIAHFAYWLTHVQPLRYLREEKHVHAFFAVLQHYGVPTNYVDFTVEPDVAGFFATCGPDVASGEKGCIIALDPDRFVAWLRTVAEVQGIPKDNWPEKVIVQVDGLWRMQAQSGYFVYLPVGDVERVVSYDRIVFTHDESTYHIAEDRIYPKAKSDLEILLDEFFTKELMLDNQAYMRKVFSDLRRKGVSVTELTFESPSPLQHLRADATPDPSWNALDDRWRAVSTQEWSTASTTQETALSIPSTRCQVDIRRSLEQQLLSSISSDVSRATPCSFAVRASDESTLDTVAISTALARLWDGMRSLPYTTSQIITALVRTVERLVIEPEPEDQILVEVASDEEVTARAQVSWKALRGCLRDDLRSLLNDPGLIDDPQMLLQAIGQPEYLFDLPRLIDFFASELIPGQMVQQRADLAVFFSPARLKTFGLA